MNAVSNKVVPFPGVLPESMRVLGDMLTYRRPHDSPGEAAFVAKYVVPVTDTMVCDGGGTIHAYMRTIPEANGSHSPAVFCSHVDSVHNRQNLDIAQRIGYDPIQSEFFVSNPEQRDCLGADDAAGVYVMREMIAAGVPGLYVFFRGEERGGIGSGWVSDNRSDIFNRSRYAIQFDRRGTRSIITQMMVGETCSDAFAKSLARVLDMGHVPDNTGSFTDTANLSEFLPECTNISIGYENEHSRDETLDADYVLALTDAMIRTFLGGSPKLDIVRKAGDYGDLGRWSMGGYKKSKYEPVVYDDEDPTLSDLDDDAIWDIACGGDESLIFNLLCTARDMAQHSRSVWDFVDDADGTT